MTAVDRHNAVSQGDGARPADIVGFRIAGQLFGIAVESVCDVVTIRQFAPIPLAQPEVLGSLNLRGHVATVVDLRQRLGLAALSPRLPSMSVVVEHQDHLYALLVDSVGDLVTVPADGFFPVPPTLPQALRSFAQGVLPHGNDLLVLLEVVRIFAIEQQEAA